MKHAIARGVRIAVTSNVDTPERVRGPYNQLKSVIVDCLKQVVLQTVQKSQISLHCEVQGEDFEVSCQMRMRLIW